ncbi:DNA mismatch repair protein Mlh3-like [Hydractinia symbiolongicarpus]|uniref:DNA mismatch repair protein Mlh3-like n=1 Tax=Hydractinia symbiolongicarpus TaxID=13093 RepID=UPI00254DDE8D|nr:DNA mismatch repair protein Mlh3-like [Hydractinia symbiolongicarpus]
MVDLRQQLKRKAETNVTLTPNINSTKNLSKTQSFIFDSVTGKKAFLGQYANPSNPTNGVKAEYENICASKKLDMCGVLLKSYASRRELQKKIATTPPMLNLTSNLCENVQPRSWTVSAKDKTPGMQSLSLLNKVDVPKQNLTITPGKIVEYATDQKPLVPLDKTWTNPIIGSDKVLGLPSVVSKKGLSRSKAFDKVFSTVTFTKQMLHTIDVIGQVDDKFIACVLKNESMLVLVDQHAAHERIRLEKLLKQIGFYKNELTEKSIKNQVTRLNPPAHILFEQKDMELVMHYRKEFGDIGLNFSVVKKKHNNSIMQKMLLSNLPAMFVNVCESQLEAKGSVVNSDLVKEFILEQLNYLRTASGRCNMSSTTIFKVLASHACHGAIKFGDKLSLSTCNNIMKELSKCDLPFQCAHGRPSIAPLLKLDMIGKLSHCTTQKLNLSKLRQNIV